MKVRYLSIVLAMLALAVFASQSFAAEKVHDGKLVQAGDGKITMTDKDGSNKQTHTVAPDAKITCDGKECKLEDLKADIFVKVTLKDDGKTATNIEGKTK